MADESIIELPPKSKGELAQQIIDEKLKDMAARTIQGMASPSVADPNEWQARVGRFGRVKNIVNIPLTISPPESVVIQCQAQAQRQFDAALAEIQEQVKALPEFTAMQEAYERLEGQADLKRNRELLEELDTRERDFINGTVGGFDPADAARQREELRISRLGILAIHGKLAEEFSRRKTACLNKANSIANASKIAIWAEREQAAKTIMTNAIGCLDGYTAVTTAELLAGLAPGLEAQTHQFVDSVCPPLPMPVGDSQVIPNEFAKNFPHHMVRPGPGQIVGWVPSPK